MKRPQDIGKKKLQTATNKRCVFDGGKNVVHANVRGIPSPQPSQTPHLSSLQEPNKNHHYAVLKCAFGYHMHSRLTQKQQQSREPNVQPVSPWLQTQPTAHRNRETERHSLCHRAATSPSTTHLTPLSPHRPQQHLNKAYSASSASFVMHLFIFASSRWRQPI